MFDLPLDPKITLEDTIAFHSLLLASGAPISEVNTLRKHFSAVKGGQAGDGRAGRGEDQPAGARCATADAWTRFLPVPRRPITPPWARCGNCWPNTTLRRSSRRPFALFLSARTCPSRRATKAGSPALPRLPWTGPPAPTRRVTSAARCRGEDVAFRDSVFEVLLSSHDLVENARALAREGGIPCGGRQQLRRLGLCRRRPLPAGALSLPARHPPAALPDLSRRGDREAGQDPGRRRPQPAVCDGLRSGAWSNTRANG